MITDKERLEVVARLREWLAIPWYERPWSRDAMQSLGKMVGAVPGENIVERIADLIDRPTCHLIEDEDGYTACSECGCTALCMRDATYCPACGRVIVNDYR